MIYLETVFWEVKIPKSEWSLHPKHSKVHWVPAISIILYFSCPQKLMKTLEGKYPSVDVRGKQLGNHYTGS